jgi:hypothetical protein
MSQSLSPPPKPRAPEGPPSSAAAPMDATFDDDANSDNSDDWGE